MFKILRHVSLLFFLISNLSYMHSQCTDFDLSLNFIGNTIDGVQYDLVINDSPNDARGFDIDVVFNNGSQIVIDETATENSLNGNFTSNYNFQFVSSGGNEIVRLDDFDFNTDVTLNSPSTLFSVFVQVEGGVCITPTIATDARIFSDSDGFCDIDMITNPLQYCAPQITVSGELVTIPVQCNGATNFGLLNAEVEAENLASSNVEQVASTTNNGDYSVSGLIMNNSYEFQPQKDAPDDCGLNTFDIDRLIDHVTNVNYFTDAWQFIAGDANNSGHLSNFDVVFLRRTVNGEPNGIYQAWDFALNYGGLIPPSDNTSFPTFDNTFTINNITTNSTGNDIAGIKIGDVIASCTDCSNSLAAEPIAKSSKNFYLNRQFSTDGGMVKIPISATNFTNQTVFSLGLDILPQFLEVVTLEAGALPEFDEEAYNISLDKEGQINIVWFTLERGGITIADHEPLFYIVARPKLALPSLNEVIEQSFDRHDNVIHTEGVKEAERINLVSLINLNAPTTNNTGAAEVTPNPFTNTVSISYQSAIAATATVEVFDLNGKQLLQTEVQNVKGVNEFTLGNTIILPKGILLYKITTADFTYSGRLIKQ